MNTKFSDKVERHAKIIWQGKRKKNFFFGKMHKVTKFYKAFYIRKVVKFKKEKQLDMHVLKRGYKITHKTHPCSKLSKSLGTM
jgi:hypothetical protein